MESNGNYPFASRQYEKSMFCSIHSPDMFHVPAFENITVVLDLSDYGRLRRGYVIEGEDLFYYLESISQALNSLAKP